MKITSVSLASLALATAAHAQVTTYSNLGPGDTRDVSYRYATSVGIFPNAQAELAWDFVTSRSGEVIAGRFGLYRETTESQVVFSLYAAHPDGGPGQLVGSWTFWLPSSPSGPGTYLQALPGDIRIEANKRYYFAVRTANNRWWQWWAAYRLPNGQFPSSTIAQRPGTGGPWQVFQNSSPPALALLVNPCGSADFDGDGDFGTDQDIEAFFRCLAGTCCDICYPGGSDFNGDGDFGTDQDIEAFFRVLAGESC